MKSGKKKNSDSFISVESLKHNPSKDCFKYYTGFRYDQYLHVFYFPLAACYDIY